MRSMVEGESLERYSGKVVSRAGPSWEQVP
jgi:hypothetical protein